MTYRATHLPLVIVALILLGVGGDALAMPLAADLPQANLLIAGRFRISIAGLDLSSADAVSAEVDPIEIEMHDVTESNDPTWKQFTNGAVRFGKARFTFRVSDSNFNKDLAEWSKDVTERGDKALKTISITILDKDGSTVGRTYNLIDCFPVSFSGGDFSAAGGSLDLVNRNCPRCPQSDSLAELIVQIGSMIIDDGAQTDPPDRDPSPRARRSTDVDQVVRYRGFAVEIENVDNIPPRSDSSWTSARGGAVITDSVETVSNDGERTVMPGKQYVSDITMTGYLTSTLTRRALLQWMNNSIAGAGDLRADVTIVPKRLDGTPGPAHHYSDAMITRIKFPGLFAGSAEPIEDEVTLKPTRRADR